MPGLEGVVENEHACLQLARAADIPAAFSEVRHFGESDAHAKNYSLLHGPGSELRLAPLYDVISVVPYPEYYLPRLKLAMRVGGEYRVASIQRRHWEQLAVSSDLSPQLTLEVVGGVCEAVTRAMEEIGARSRQEGVAHPALDRLEEGVLRQADQCRSALES